MAQLSQLRRDRLTNRTRPQYADLHGVRSFRVVCMASNMVG
jgi:hypothetical protein